MNWLTLIILGVMTFTATNIDDSLLLVLFFSDRRFRARHVFVGQALGIGLLVMISLLGAWLALAVAGRWIGLLGLLPIILGVRELLARRAHDDGSTPALETAVTRAPPGWRQSAAVAGVTLANGGDNIGVYTPLFAALPPEQTALLLAVFTIMLAVWLCGAFYLARRSAVAGRVQRAGRAVFPYALIGLGMIILAEAFLFPTS
jgi:cadmium resistance protein CadD (predicted permease)